MRFSVATSTDGFLVKFILQLPNNYVMCIWCVLMSAMCESFTRWRSNTFVCHNIVDLSKREYCERITTAICILCVPWCIRSMNNKKILDIWIWESLVSCSVRAIFFGSLLIAARTHLDMSNAQIRRNFDFFLFCVAVRFTLSLNLYSVPFHLNLFLFCLRFVLIFSICCSPSSFDSLHLWQNLIESVSLASAAQLAFTQMKTMSFTHITSHHVCWTWRDKQCETQTKMNDN